MLGVRTIAHMHFLSVVAVAIASGRVQLSSLVLVQSVHSYVRTGQVISRQYALLQPWYTMIPEFPRYKVPRVMEDL